MASCQTSRWVSTAPYVKLTVTQKSSTATTATLEWKLQYISSSAASAGSRNYTVKIAGATVKTGSYNINGVTGTKTIASGTKTINKTHSAQSISFSVSFDFKITWSGVYAGTKSASGSISVAKKTSYTVSFNANGGSGAPASQTKWYGEDLTLSSTKPTKSGYTFRGWSVPGRDIDTPYYQPGGTVEYNGNQTLYAQWQKTITLSYNANGGSDAPSSQSATVYNATTSNTFTIPSTVPTREGYLFLGWSTSASATSASYSAGGNITLSANGTLYAVWRLNVFTVTYDANGGSGAPANQTKTYGTDLTLASTVPTRKYYTFKGWATSASATTPTYPVGQTNIYTSNANVTLYAVWEVAYIIPRITSVSVTRCDEQGNPQDDGTYALVKFNWATDEDVSSIKIYWKALTDTAYGNNLGVAVTGRSGSVSQVVGGGALSEDFAYNIKIEVVDNTDRNSATQTLSATLFPIDLLRGGKGVTIGGPAKEEGLRVKMPAYFEKHAEFKGGLEIFLTTPFIDFHHENSTNDYTSRIVESPAGTLNCLANWSIRDTLNVGGRLYGVNKVLWSGAMHMGESHTATLSEAVSAQPHGVVLAFSYYNNGTGEVGNHNWSYWFVPKTHVLQHTGTGIAFYTGMSIIRMKYLYVSDTTIKGYADNNSSAFSMHGQTVDNRYTVLRYVIGV